MLESNLRDEVVKKTSVIRPASMERILGLVFVALVLPVLPTGSSTVSAQDNPSCPAPGPLVRGFDGPMAHVRYLADDALEGREAGTAGARCAANYIAGALRGIGLRGAGPGGSYFQDFQVQMGSIPGDGSTFRLAGNLLTLGEAWIPYGFSSSASLTAPMIYGGFGVSRPGTEEDAYAHLDLDGKVVVIEGGDPHGAGAATMAGDPHFKASVAAGRGAAAVIVLLPKGEDLPDPSKEERPTLRIPALAVDAASAEAVRSAARAGAEVAMTTAVEPRMVTVRNVAALIPGSDPTLARQAVIVGAHYDHLGYGGEGSLAPDVRAVHNGADDNASGVAALLEVARLMTESGEPPSRTVLFLAFTGEEKGLWGSGHYVAEPLLPLDNTVAMVNMDMVGRLRDNTLTVYGTGTAQEWPSVLEELNTEETEPFTLSFIPDGFGPSDQSSFYGKGVPVLHFFTNTHSEYHRPEDDWQLINAPGLERVAVLVGDLTEELAGHGTQEALALTPVEGAGDPHAGAMAAEDAPSAPGYGAYMGTIPDMTPQEVGVRITGVREQSPAEKAGLKAGDVIVELGGREITDLYAYTYALRDHKPGDEVQVTVLRDGGRLTFTAVLGQRR